MTNAKKRLESREAEVDLRVSDGRIDAICIGCA